MQVQTHSTLFLMVYHTTSFLWSQVKEGDPRGRHVVIVDDLVQVCDVMYMSTLICLCNKVTGFDYVDVTSDHAVCMRCCTEL